MTSEISPAAPGRDQVGGEGNGMVSGAKSAPRGHGWVVERERWRPRLKVWDVRYFQWRGRGPFGGAWYRSVRYATKWEEGLARRVAGARQCRAVPLVVVLARQ